MEVKKEYLCIAVIQKLFGCGVNKAAAIIRCIKDYVPNPLPLRGKVLVTEYEAWKNRPMERGKAAQ